MINNKKGIAVAGSILVDEINYINSYPTCGTLSTIEKLERAVGGLVPNDAIDIKKIDSSIDVSVYGLIGNDELGKYVINVLNNNNINTDNIIVDNFNTTSFTQVMSIINGERTFFTYPGASSKFGFEHIDFDNLNCKIFHLGYFLLLDKIDNGDGIKILKKLKELNIETSIDLVSSNSNKYDLIIPVLPYVDYLIINEIEASNLCKINDTNDLKSLSEKLFSLGVNKKVIIHKMDKACIYDGNEYIELNTLFVPDSDIVGKTGAGDAFCSGCLTEIYHNKSNQEILDFGIRAGAISLLKADATSAILRKEEIIEYTNKYKRR